MIHISPEFNEEIPAWDVALEALLCETQQQEGRPLAAGDIHRLSQQYRIRFDDLMITLLELVARGRWQYSGEPGEIERMRGEGRFDAQDLARLGGHWRPRPK